MLLASALPFHGSSRQVVAKKILQNKYSFKRKCWRRVSPQAKEFIQSLLVLDPDQRADAETALGSSWLTKFGGTSSVDPQTQEEERAKASMLKYARYPKLKKMVRREKGRMDSPSLAPTHFLSLMNSISRKRR